MHVGDVVFGDKITVGGTHNVGKIVGGPQPAPTPPPHNILMLMSNPQGTQPLRLAEEHRLVDQAITGARYRARIDLRIGTAVQVNDLQNLVMRYKPVVVHFSGHGTTNGIVLTGDRGDKHIVPPAALSRLFAILGERVKCVVLNACLSRDQAIAIAPHVPCVVGMSRTVLDSVAIKFAEAFYGAIANGESVATAFDLGRDRLDPGASNDVGRYRDVASIRRAVPGWADNPVLIGAAEGVFIVP